MITTTFSALGSIYDGPHATPTRLDEGPYFLNIASLQNGRLDLAQSDHVSGDDFVRWTRRVTPRGGDLLFSYETRLGSAALMPDGVDACLGRRMALLRPHRGVIDPRYLLFRYLAPDFQETIRSNAIHGATVDRIPLTSMGAWPIQVHPLEEQRAIAEVLGALDDAIAAARRVAQSCLRLADACFGEVLRTSTVATATYGDVAVIGGGGTPSTAVAEYWDGDIAWVTPTDVTQLDLPYLAETSRTLTSEGARASSSPLYPEGSILMTSRATIGAFALAMAPTTVNQGFIVVQARADADRWWLLHEMQGRVDYYKSHANGATFLELPRSRFKDLSVRWPDEATRTAFSQRVAPLHRRAYASSVSSKRLAALRDALLPELMSGRIRVKDAQQRAEEAI